MIFQIHTLYTILLLLGRSILKNMGDLKKPKFVSSVLLKFF